MQLSCVDQPQKWSIWTSLQQIARIHSTIQCDTGYVCCYNGDMWEYTDVESRPWGYWVYITNHAPTPTTREFKLLAVYFMLILQFTQLLQWTAQRHYSVHK